MTSTLTLLEREILAKLLAGDATTRQLAWRLRARHRYGEIERTCENLMCQDLISSLGQASSATRALPSSWWTINDRAQALALALELEEPKEPARVEPGRRSRLSPLAMRRSLQVVAA